MQRGTYQNGLALGEMQGLKETLVNAALAPLGEFDILAEEGIAGEAAEEEAEEAALAGQCFPAGTTVQAKDKATPVERVKTGDAVWSRNPVTGRTEIRRVVRLFRHVAHALVTVRLATKAGKVVQTLTATPGHRFFVVGRGPVPLGQLGVGTQVVTRAGPPLVIASVARRFYRRGVTVYNFEVQGDHTYFVGNAEDGVWVHNDCTPLFELADRVDAQLNDPRLGSLAGQLTPEMLNDLLNNPAAQRLFDAATGNINVIQDVNGVLLRITTPRDAFRIISVGPVRGYSIINGIGSGRYIPLP